MSLIAHVSDLKLRHTRLCTLALCLFGAGLISGCGGPSKGPIVDTPLGQVQGNLVEQVHVFRDLPYAQPPVGAKRWQRPQPALPWNNVRDATEDRFICEQPVAGPLANSFLDRLLDGAGFSSFGKFMLSTFAGLAGNEPMNEDCLTLTVRTTALEADAKLPVMFWIHGGGHRFGSGNQGFSNSNALAERGVVQVSINYRLGVWGFFAHEALAAEDPDGSTGNYGMLDQIEALKWVQANIASFGGDPDNVTIFGESAGGHSVGQLLASPLTKGLIHGAIAQSGTGNQQMQHVHHQIESLSGIQAGQRFAELAGIDTNDALAGLRALSVEQIRALENSDLEIGSTYHPQVDGYALPKTVAQIFAAGEHAHVPFMLGSNADEGSVLGYLIPISIDGVAELRPDSVEGWDNYLNEHIPSLAKEYAVESKSDLQDAHFRLVGDAMFGRHAYYTAEHHFATGSPTWLYFFERAPASDSQVIGATHALELQPVFNSYIPFWPKDERDTQLSQQMGDYWTNFAKTKNPNGGELPQWPSFDPAIAQELALGHLETHARKVDRQSIYDGMRAQQQQRIAQIEAITEDAI